MFPLPKEKRMASGNSRKNTTVLESHGPIMKQTQMWTNYKHSMECMKRSNFGLEYFLFGEMDITLEA